MFVKVLLYAVVTGLLAIVTAGPASASSSPVVVNALNTYNSGDDAGNDSIVEIDRSLNFAKGDGSPGSDVINEVSGASSGMSPGSSNGSLTGSSTSLVPGESDDE
ncbi:hypothetical protein [Actinomadura rubrisoli]|uniref:hypothetical protein n=1 Tax=Actinomadura rubrisoli TaxID=2530368 RepID=UPI001A9DC95C|nr:hypothetical protein [Actinomadura rubrisoli]